VRLGDTIDAVLARLGGPSRAGVEVVFERWADVVGESMAARTRPVSIDESSLVVLCDDPALTTHVRFLEPQLLARLAELAGDRQITRVEVRVDRRRGPARASRRTPVTTLTRGIGDRHPSSGTSHPAGRLFLL
jgi:predicted nucleic acid-binding Zn ribbon protein